MRNFEFSFKHTSILKTKVKLTLFKFIIHCLSFQVTNSILCHFNQFIFFFLEKNSDKLRKKKTQVKSHVKALMLHITQQIEMVQYTKKK